MGEGVIRNEESVARVIAPVSQCLNEAAWGRATWDDVCKSITGVLPGVVPMIRNFDLPRRTVNAMFVEGLETEHITAYRDHYVGLDPWIDSINEISHGQVCNSERHHPSASFRDSEFYNGWLSRHDNLKAATGLRIDVDASNVVIVCLHYTIKQAPTMDGLASAMLGSLMPALIDAVRSAAMLRSGLERGPRLGSVIEHVRGSAVLMDSRRRICEANAEAINAMERGEICGDIGNILVLRDPVAQRWLEETNSQLLTLQDPHTAVRTFLTGNQAYRISMTRACGYSGINSDLLLHPQPNVLVVIRLLTSGSLQLDVEALSLAFGLTPAESRLCQTLANGYSLVESAHHLRISEGTVRQRTKAIFQKTGTHRQGELIARVSPFAVD